MSEHAEAMPEVLHLWPHRPAECPHCEKMIDDDHPLEVSDDPVPGSARVTIKGRTQNITLEDIQPRCPHCWGRVSLVLEFERERKFVKVSQQQLTALLTNLPFPTEVDVCRIPEPPIQTWNRMDLQQAWPACVIARQYLHSELGGEDEFEVLEEIQATYGKP